MGSFSSLAWREISTIRYIIGGIELSEYVRLSDRGVSSLASASCHLYEGRILGSGLYTERCGQDWPSSFQEDSEVGTLVTGLGAMRLGGV